MTPRARRSASGDPAPPRGVGATVAGLPAAARIRTDAPFVVDRVALLEALARGRRVLDLGAADGSHLEVHRTGGAWLHARLAAVSAACVGVDLDATVVARLRAEGWDVRHGDATALDLGEAFDVVVAGEILEHVTDAGGLLDSCARHLTPGGTLVVTTPNAFALHARPGPLAPLMRTGGIHPDHVAWYCAATLRQLLDRLGWANVAIGYGASPSVGRAKRAFRRAAFRLRPAWSETLIAVAGRRPATGEGAP